MLRYALVSFVFMPALLSAAPELKGDPADLTNYLLDGKRVVAITGSGEAKVQADRATVTLRVRTKDSAFAQALKLNREVRAKLSQQLQQAGITPDHISSAKFSSVPNYGFFGTRPTSYEISNDVSVVLRGEDDMIVIAQAVDGMKEVSYLAAQFEDSNKKAHEGDALNDALASIARKKSAYEKALGFTLVPLRVGDVSYQHIRQLAAPVAYDQSRPQFAPGSDGASMSMAVRGNSESVASENDSEGGGFGELRYESSVRAEYLVQTR